RNGHGETLAHGSLERVQPVGDLEAANDELSSTDDEESTGAESTDSRVDSVPAAQPFARLPSLPPDLSDAFEAFKLAILRQRLTHWHDVARDDVLDSLEALKQFSLAPLENGAA